MRLHKLLLFLITLGVSTSALAQQATVRLIHNSPDAALDSVTVYEGLTGTEVTGIGFRGNQSVDVPVNGGTLPIGLAPASGSVTDTVGFTLEGLQADSTYVAVVNGILQANQNQYEDFEPLSLQVQRVPSGRNQGNVGLAVNHGSPDAPNVDVNETGVGAGEQVADLPYGSLTGFLTRGVQNYQFEITPAGADAVVGRFDAPLSDLNAGGLDLVVFASGFLDTTNNNNGPEFGLFAAAPGVGVLPLEALTAQLQLVHNVPDPAADSVDVFINGDRAYEDVEFRNASPLETVPGAGEIEVAVAAPGADRSDALLTANVNLPQDTSVIGVINGLVNTGDFTVDEGLAIHTAGLRTSANMSGNTDVLIHHGSEDAGVVTIADTSEGQDLVSGVDYPAFSNNYIPLTTQNYTLTVQKGGDNLASFDANLSDLNLGGESATVIASGLFMEANREAGEDFGLLAVLTDGTTQVLPQNESGLASAKAEIGLETYPNPVSDELRISFGQNKYDQARIDVVSMDGQVVNTKRTAPAGTHTISMDGLSNGTYVVRVAANGQTVGTKTIVKQ
jgi:hypothetical protein